MAPQGGHSGVGASGPSGEGRTEFKKLDFVLGRDSIWAGKSKRNKENLYRLKEGKPGGSERIELREGRQPRVIYAQ